MELKTIELKIGIPFLITVGAAFHFTFEWSGYFEPLAWIWSVNESPWEHMKLILFPMLFYTLITYKWTKDKANNYFLAKLVHYFVAMVFMIGVFYLYNLFTGEHYLIADIILFMIGAATGHLTSYKIMMKERMVKLNLFAGLLLLGIITISVLWTYYPPHLNIFAQKFDDGDIFYGILDDYNHDH